MSVPISVSLSPHSLPLLEIVDELEEQGDMKNPLSFRKDMAPGTESYEERGEAGSWIAARLPAGSSLLSM